MNEDWYTLIFRLALRLALGGGGRLKKRVTVKKKTRDVWAGPVRA